MKLLTIGCLLLIANSISAQSLINKDQQRRQYIVKALLNRQLQNHDIAAKSTSIKERIVGQDTHPLGLATLDSIIYIYSGANGSDFDFNYMNYSQDVGIQYNYPLIWGFNQYVYPSLKPSVATDTFIEYHPGRNSIYKYTNFNTDGEITAEHSFYNTSSTPYIGQYYQLNYNASNMPVSIFTFYDTMGMTPTDTVSSCYYSYNASGQLIQDSIYYSGSPNTKYIYSYDGSGNINKLDYYQYTAPSWVYYDTYLLTYNSSNLITSIEIDTGTGASVSASSKEDFSYDGGTNFFTSDSTLYMSGASWVPSKVITKHINVAGLPDSVLTTYFYSAGNFYYYDYFIYDTYNNPTIKYDSSVSGSGVRLVNITNFYYELYTVTGINNISQQSNNTVIYPNPTSSDITIKTDKNEPIKVMVINSLGQKVINTTPLTTATLHTLSLANIVSGIYWIFVYDNNNKLIHSQSFVKR